MVIVDMNERSLEDIAIEKVELFFLREGESDILWLEISMDQVAL
jgi:hypothetical protein